MGCLSGKNIKNECDQNQILQVCQNHPKLQILQCETNKKFIIQDKKTQRFKKCNYLYVPRLNLSANLFYRKRIERSQKFEYM